VEYRNHLSMVTVIFHKIYFLKNYLKTKDNIMYNQMTDTVVDTSSSRYTGRVKWFNNKAGYGFITVTDGPRSGSDIFVHHSSIRVGSEQYKYLVQGEYIEFSITPTNGGSHEFQATEVAGIKGGKLMCETRREVRTSRIQYNSSKTVDTASVPATTDAPVVSAPKSRKPPQVRARGQGPREDKSSGEWVQVAAKKADTGATKRAPRQKKVATN
jgi:cold shock protein